jgi:hypothetical protein
VHRPTKDTLTNIHNASPESGTFPDKLKTAKVIPVHKKGDTRDIQNYGPIALLPVFSKLLEKLMYSRLRYNMALGQENQWKQHYRFLLKVYRKQSRKI